MEKLDLFGGSVPVGPPKVPSVTFWPISSRRDIRGEGRIQCGHCQMNAQRFRAGKPVLGWHSRSDIKVLHAIFLITQRDGSTLTLCAQHAQEHDERGNRDG